MTLPEDLNTTQPIDTDPTLPRSSATTATGLNDSAFDFNSLSDNDLMSLASLLGIDSSAFGGQGQNQDMFQIDPAVGSAVSQVYQSQRQLGQDELQRKAVESAGARGLNMTDTPISDPYMRGQALLESQLRGNEAASLLGIGTDWAKHRDNLLGGLYQGDANRATTKSLGMMSLFNTGANIGLGLNSGSFSQSGSGSSGGLDGRGLGAIGLGLQGLNSSLGGLFGGGGNNSPTSGWWGSGDEFSF